MFKLCFIILFINHFITKSHFAKYDVFVIPLSEIFKNRHLIYSAPIYREKFVARSSKANNERDEEFNEETKENIEEDLQDNIDGDNIKSKRIVEKSEESVEYFASAYGRDKIVGGHEVEMNLYPYHVEYGTNCAGAIISNMWVITAGHCGKKYFIRYGSKYNNQGQVVLVRRSIVHPKWGAVNKEHPFDYDYQLLELQKPLIFSLNAQPIKIAHIENMVIGTVITVTGWGHTTENGKYSDVLRAIRVPIISKENCQKVRFPYFRGQLTARMFCAGFPDGKLDACQGDSGGPAVANGRLLGLVSFGYGCATPGSYGVYSKLALVRDWIGTTTKLKLD